MSVAAVMAELPSVEWITDPALVRQRSRDFFWYSPVLKRQLNGVTAEAVACPRDEAEVMSVMAACVRHQVPLTPRGAGTGNYGQAMPLKGGIVLDLMGLNRVVWVKPGVVRAQAGCKLIDLDAVTRREVRGELRFHPSTKRTASIGGFIAGGSSGIGSCTYGKLREFGNILGLRVVTMEAEPRVLELRGPDIDKANHAYGTNGVITEVEMPLAPAWDWIDVLAGFPDTLSAARFCEALVASDGIAKKMAGVVAPGVAQTYFKLFQSIVPAGMACAMVMVAEPFLDLLDPLLAQFGGTRLYAVPTDQAETPLYEFTWNHTTLQALKVDRSLTYLQTLFPTPHHFELIAKMERTFGDEVPMHLEFVRLGGVVTCFGLQLVRYTTEERLREIIRIHEDAGAPIFNPHAFTLEEGGMKRIDGEQLEFKREADPHGLLNPGKMIAWDDPDWTPDRPQGFYLYGRADAPEVEEVLE
jgi:FAD/FMN-containing dehydrogenase